MSVADAHGSDVRSASRVINLVDQPAQPVNVLLIEKDPQLADFIRTALKESAAEFEITTAPDLRGALGFLSRHGTQLILVDLDLPDIRGSATIQFLTRAAPWAPLIALSGTDDFDVALNAVRAGAEECVSKSSFSAQSLVLLVVLVLERHRRLTTGHDLEATDSLTGLATFSALQVFGRYLLHLSDRTGMHLGLLHLRIEPTGHGRWRHWEALLVEVSRVLDQTLRRCDVLSRVGPMELAVVLVTNSGNLVGVLPRVRDALAATGAVHHVQMGLALHRPPEPQTLDQLLELARGAATPLLV